MFGQIGRGNGDGIVVNPTSVPLGVLGVKEPMKNYSGCNRKKSEAWTGFIFNVSKMDPKVHFLLFHVLRL